MTFSRILFGVHDLNTGVFSATMGIQWSRTPGTISVSFLNPVFVVLFLVLFWSDIAAVLAAPVKLPLVLVRGHGSAPVRDREEAAGLYLALFDPLGVRRSVTTPYESVRSELRGVRQQACRWSSSHIPC